MIFIDCFEHDGKMVLWCKDSGNRFFEDSFSPVLYYETFNERFSRKVMAGLSLKKETMLHMDRGKVEIFKVTFPSIGSFRRSFRAIETLLRDVGMFYGADQPHEQMYMDSKGLFPLAEVDQNLDVVDSRFRYHYPVPDFRIAKIRILEKGVEFNHHLLSFSEFKEAYCRFDPDILFIHGQRMPLVDLAAKMGMNLDRIGTRKIAKGKGNTFFSYGTVFYREAPLFLKGRLLIDSAGFMDSSFNLLSIMEGARICRMPIQLLASRSVGAAITSLLSWQAREDRYLIPYKSGYAEKVKQFRTLVECDRGALTLEPVVGLHKSVAELDFVSMFPSIISRYNLSPETFDCSCCKDQSIPGTPYTFCTKKKGVVPVVCDYLIDRRDHFRKENDNISKAKAAYIKWLLVVIFGFQGCRHKKIGRIEVHEAINAIARETLLAAMRIAESRGYEIVHGIVDSLYIKKERMRRSDLHSLIAEIDQKTGLKIEFKDMFRAIVFLPSVNRRFQPVPGSYYGMSADGELKVRGIEIRQRSSPEIVRRMQEEMIMKMDAENILKWMDDSIQILRRHIDGLAHATADDLAITIRIGKESYQKKCPQKQIREEQKRRGIPLVPGQAVKYVIVSKGQYVEYSRYRRIFDRNAYAMLLKKAMLRLFLPFGLTIDQVEMMVCGQATLERYIFLSPVKHIKVS